MQQARAGDPEHLAALKNAIAPLAEQHKPPVIGITGTGGAGKSSLTDEIIVRFLHDIKEISIAVICCDPSRRKTGGALLGDRIRMNAISNSERVYMRSLATRDSANEVSEALPEAILVVKAAGFDLIIAETAGIGQGDSKITDLCDISIYVMTSDYGAPSQLEKIDMLDYADIIVVNKFEKKGSDDAISDIRKQVQRNRKAWDSKPDDFPVYGTIASKFNDDGVTALYHGIIDVLRDRTGFDHHSTLPRPEKKVSSSKAIVIPPDRIRYLAEIADTIRSYHRLSSAQADKLRRRNHLQQSAALLRERGDDETRQAVAVLDNQARALGKEIDKETDELLRAWDETRKAYSGDELVYQVRGREIRVPLYTTSLSHSKIPKIALPKFSDPGDIYLAAQRTSARLFPLYRRCLSVQTNRRGPDPDVRRRRRARPRPTSGSRLLSANYEAKRLSTAFDSVTLYGWDPAERPDIYGKIGTSGVSICTLDDVKLLYDGFDLCSPTTSVSMTINGPAPIILAMFMNTAIDQQLDKFRDEQGRQPDEHEAKNRSGIWS